MPNDDSNPKSTESAKPAESTKPTESAPAPQPASTSPAATGATPTTSAKGEETSQALQDEAKKTIAANEAAEQKALKEKMKGNQKNWTPPTGGETYMMAMAAREARMACKRLNNEMKALKEQQAEKREARVEKAVIATEKLNGLMQVLDRDTNEPNSAKLDEWRQANPDKNFNETLLEAIGEYREATGKEYRKPDKDGGQDPISAIEDKAEKCVKLDANTKKIEENEAATEKTVAVEQTDSITVSPK